VIQQPLLQARRGDLIPNRYRGIVKAINPPGTDVIETRRYDSENQTVIGLKTPDTDSGRVNFQANPGNGIRKTTR
jgi:hypothetical protein